MRTYIHRHISTYVHMYIRNGSNHSHSSSVGYRVLYVCMYMWEVGMFVHRQG